eukprot:EG_transcript_14198
MAGAAVWWALLLAAAGWRCPAASAPSLPDFIARWVTTDNILHARHRPYSSHRCLNLAENPMATPTNYTRAAGYRHVCLLHNVCFDPDVSKTFPQYYEDPAAVEQASSASPKYFDNGPHTTFPPFSFCDLEQPVVQIATKPFPSQPLWMTPSVYALVCPHRCTYFSHLWIDNIVPFFWGAQLVGAYDPAQFGILWMSALHEAPTEQKCPCEPLFAKWVWPSGLVANHSQCKLQLTHRPVCFENLIVGAEAFAYSSLPRNALSGMSLAYGIVRDVVRYGVAGLRPGDGPRRQAVLVIRKRGKRRLLNVGALLQHLKVCFPGVPAQEISMETSAADQLRAVNGATVVIAPSGTVAFTALFLPRRAVLIQVDRHMPSINRSVPTDQYVFMNAGVHFMAYNVLPAEIKIE